MLQRLRTGFFVILGLSLALTVSRNQITHAQQATAAAPAAPGLSPAMLKQTLATVNGTPITRGELINFLSRVPLNSVDQKEAYRLGVELMANNLLIKQFLIRSRISVTEPELAAKVAEIEKRLKAEQNRELKTVLAESNMTLEDFKAQDLYPRLAWEKYINAVATDTALKKFADDNKDVFSRTQVKASHILILVPEDAPATAKEAAKQKLVGIKAQVEGGKIAFADAANKYSEDDANKTSPNGGDLGYFVRKGQFIEKFAAAAFGMQKGQVSDPIETEYGLHLIQVTDRKPGQPFDFAANKAAVLNQYRADLEERVVTSERKTAKIDIQPMPADFFPPPTAAPAGAPATKGAATSPSAPK